MRAGRKSIFARSRSIRQQDSPTGSCAHPSIHRMPHPGAARTSSTCAPGPQAQLSMERSTQTGKATKRPRACPVESHARSYKPVASHLHSHFLTLTRSQRKLPEVVCLNDRVADIAQLYSELAVYGLRFTYALLNAVIIATPRPNGD